MEAPLIRGSGKAPEKVQRGRGRGQAIHKPPLTSNLPWEVKRYTEVHQTHTFGHVTTHYFTILGLGRKDEHIWALCYMPSQKRKERPLGSLDVDISLEHPEERPEVLLSAVLATPQLGRVPEGVQSDLEDAGSNRREIGGSRQTLLEPNTNVTDFVEAIHIPDRTRVTGSGPEGGCGNRG
ncbi:hypothetical protein DFH07DRAFT_765813 [Mycena maculata]|uniref:Uncharacterized protein n=1 Tax=Mycena maculata TaxID=230809 RepID=A0AAD7NWY0_9AGAR|nr:hypothetical protein DFH07DRAFT_765813 [Mycena maculata]